jgi:hypothetical protein
MAGPAADGEVWRIGSVVSTASVLGLIIVVWAALQRCVVATSTGIDGGVVAAAAKDCHA